jgi:CRISPR system Cascade subunit CasD
MSTPLRGVPLRLHGPLQAWGGSVVGDGRPTLPFPTRSGVLGVVAACMGIKREEQTRLLALADGARVHVRVDAAGVALVDDQTIQGNPNASPTRQTIQSKRSYLCDASFVAVVVPGPDATVEAITAALKQPVFAPFLGRRSCVPSTPLFMQDEVTGDDPVGLFRNLERGPSEVLTMLGQRRWSGGPGDETDTRGNLAAPAHEDFYLDVADYRGALRRIPVRDDFTGPLPRQWRERFAVHVRVEPTSKSNPH